MHTGGDTPVAFNGILCQAKRFLGVMKILDRADPSLSAFTQLAAAEFQSLFCPYPGRQYRVHFLAAQSSARPQSWLEVSAFAMSM